MITIACDACKKNISAPRSGFTYVSVLDKDLCMPCYKKLKNSTEEIMEKERSYHLENHAKNQRSVLARMTK